ncbi:hypothetical protein ACN47E_007234 [Coniothyrium glycines]
MIVAIFVGMSFGLLVVFGYRLTPLLFSRRNIKLSFSPNELRTGEIVIVILAMAIKLIVPNSMIDFLASADVSLSSPFIMTEEHIARYQIAIGKRSSKITEVSPLHQLLFLSAITEPAMLILLSSPACPVNPLGAVNVRNRFELLRPDLCVPSAFKNFGQATLLTNVHTNPRHVKRGVEFDIEITLRIQDQTSIGGTILIYRQIFTMLEFRRIKQQDVHVTSHRGLHDDAFGFSNAAQISFNTNDPLKWAALSKDYNFIHLSSAAAKAFGLPGKLAHGNHAIARALQNIQIPTHGNTRAWMEVDFRRPMSIPGEFDVILTNVDAASTGFAVAKAEKIYVTARYGVLGKTERCVTFEL